MSKVWNHTQDHQQTRVQLRSNALQRKIDAWVKIQTLYIPSVATLQKNKDRDAITKDLPEHQPHDFPLWLPSQIKFQVKVDSCLADIEWRLRIAQAHETLENVQHNLQMRAHLYCFKQRNVRGQGANTCARNAIAVVQTRIDMSTAEYHVAQCALSSLASQLGKVRWDAILQPLQDADICELMVGKDSHSEGKWKMSWIWKTFNNAADIEHDEGLCDGKLYNLHCQKYLIVFQH